jgi:hypothetical protein
MKIFTFLLIVFFIPGFLIAQKQIQLKDQRFEMNAVREGKPVKVETKKFGLILNYETGEFYAKINLTDSRLYADDEFEFRIPGDEILEITGIIPINEIINNQEQTKQYIYELEVKHLSANVPVVFTFDLGYISNSARGFTIFRVNGNINLLDFEVQDLKGYEPEVNLFLGFQAYMIGQ